MYSTGWDSLPQMALPSAPLEYHLGDSHLCAGNGRFALCLHTNVRIQSKAFRFALVFAKALTIVRALAKAEVGFEPTNHGFAIRSLSPLGYSAKDRAGYYLAGSIATLNQPRVHSRFRCHLLTQG